MNAATQQEAAAPVDDLDRRWLWAVYGSIFVPFVGPWLLIIGSSVLYYAWRGKTPRRAAQLNTHAWVAWATGLVLQFAIRMALKHP